MDPVDTLDDSKYPNNAFLMLENLVPQQTAQVYQATADFIATPAH